MTVKVKTVAQLSVTVFYVLTFCYFCTIRKVVFVIKQVVKPVFVVRVKF